MTPGERIGWLAISPSIPDRQPLRDAIELAQMAGGWLFPNAVLQYAIDDLETLSIDLAELEAKRDRLAPNSWPPGTTCAHRKAPSISGSVRRIPTTSPSAAASPTAGAGAAGHHLRGPRHFRSP